jgi:hypothetical protein
MIDDAFVFDCVAHVFNFDPKNAFGNPGLMFDQHLYAFHNALTPDDQPKLPPEEFLRQWTPGDIRKMVYEESDTDMLVAMPLPLTDLFHDGLSPWEACADLAGRDPDRTVFWGTVNPLEGRKALDLMERQVGEFNARASSSTTSATTTGRRTRGGWTTRTWPSPSSRRPRNSAST